MSSFPKRGEIYWIDLEPIVGAETKKTRPCLIISGDIGNQYSPLVMIAPITSKVHKVYPFEVQIKIGKKDGKVMLNQARAIDKSRLGNKIGYIGFDELKNIDEAIKIVFGIFN